MLRPICRTFAFVLPLSLALAGLGMAQDNQQKGVKKAPVTPTSPASGAEMFKQYCAPCHGKEGKGNGPAASSLKQAPADLSTLAKRHDGKFPDDYVRTVLRFGVKAPAHGSSDMPTWGPLLSAVSGADKAQVELRINNLIDYLKSLQAK
jgi:mono/diheme cytochrome c family protein